MLWTSFPDRLDPAAIPAIFDIALKRRPIDKNKDGLICFNVSGFAYSTVIAGGSSPPDLQPLVAPMDEAAILSLEAEFKEACDSGAPEGALAAIDIGRWLTLFQLALDLIRSLR